MTLTLEDGEIGEGGVGLTFLRAGQGHTNTMDQSAKRGKDETGKLVLFVLYGVNYINIINIYVCIYVYPTLRVLVNIRFIHNTYYNVPPIVNMLYTISLKLSIYVMILFSEA